MQVGVFGTNFTILLAEMRFEIVATLICVLALHMKKLISGLVILVIQLSFPSIPLSLVVSACNNLGFGFFQSCWVKETGDIQSM